MTKPAEVLTDEMISATEFIEAAARTWQEDHPGALPACFLMSTAKFLADSFWSVSEETFEALLTQMRQERADWKARKRHG